MSHHHTYYVTWAYIIMISTCSRTCNRQRYTNNAHELKLPCHVIMHTMSHHRTYCVTSSYIQRYTNNAHELKLLCHIIMHTMSHHRTYYVTSSYIQRYTNNAHQVKLYWGTDVRVYIHICVQQAEVYEPEMEARILKSILHSAFI